MDIDRMMFAMKNDVGCGAVGIAGIKGRTEMKINTSYMFGVNLLGALALGGTLALPAAAQEFTIRLGTPVPEGQWIYQKDLVPWAEKIKEESGGRLVIDLQPVGVYGTPDRYLELVETGVLDAAWWVNGYAPGRFERTSVIELPFMYTGGEEASVAFWTLFEEGLLGEEFTTVKPLSLFVNVPYIIMTSEKPVLTAEDFKGLNIRVSGRIIGQALEALGASAVGMPASEMAESIRLGVLDGTSFAYEAVKPFGLDALIGQFNEIPLASVTHSVIMNSDAYNRLPEDLRAIIDANSGLTLSRQMGQSYDAADAEMRAPYMDNADYQINVPTPEAIAEMRAVTDQVVALWSEQITAKGGDAQALLDRARDLAND
jgi:TRAP-type C4-dicarboxylate transport system substrate-binding protein